MIGPRTIKFDSLVVDFADNDRVVYGDIDGLAASIREVSLISPLAVVKLPDGSYKLRAGFRRYKAILVLRKTEPLAFDDLPIHLLQSGGNEVDGAIANLTENIKRKSLTPGEVALGIYRLIKLGLRQNVIAERLHISESQVSHLLRCRNSLIQEAFDAFVHGKIPTEVAVRLSHMPEADQRAALTVINQAHEEEAQKQSTGGKKSRKAAQKVRKAVGVSRPSLKELRVMAARIEPEDEYHRGVKHALEFAVGARKEISP